ncbi:hypothetical protein EHS25_001249 [Saitozyma podzolica]|uniref:Nuclear speckle splicing regulatory protein 1 N-terminal domain-containing protein n=1 Tax=Saitozyma podzolica TaxID=1890683 RepID=A0A427YHU1_9TREE|nr:hypothetical protein EHS25_001249 [Saitozyma podzolica]
MSSNSKLSFSFGAAPSNMELLMAKAKTAKASSASKSLFADDDEDDHPPPPPSLAGPSKSRSNLPSRGGAPPPPQSSKSAIGRSTKKLQDEALKIDNTVFDYDGVYDSLKAAERKRDEPKKAESDDRKPKYIESFLQSAQTRRLDKLRAEEKMMQLEREKEGDEFEDKEKFVTEAYKKQMEEVRKAEEEEKQREEAMRKSRKGPGLAAFYKQMLDTSAADHDAAVASGSASAGAGPSLAIKPPTHDEYEPEAEYDPLLAREETSGSSRRLKAGTVKIDDETGKEVEVNDEGEVVDKRSLLKAGLNITKKPKAVLPNSLLSGQRSGEVLEGPYKSRAVGTAASYQERMERERRRLAEQLKEDAERKKREHEERMRAEEDAARKRREGDDGEAERRRKEAKERFLARKRARDEGKDGDGEADAKKAKE